MMKYISKYLFIYLLQANQCAMVHVPFDDETFLYVYSFFFSWHIIYINILWKGAYTRIFRLMDSWRIQTNIYTYIQNQTRERNANVDVLSYRFNRGKETERISIRYYHFLICSNITIFFLSLWSFTGRSIIGEI